eukprot:scaffold12945_cov114-Skeletonema_menzelii.AAC.1
MTSNVMCFKVAFENNNLSPASKPYSSGAIVRKVYNQIGRLGSSHDCLTPWLLCVVAGEEG